MQKPTEPTTPPNPEPWQPEPRHQRRIEAVWHSTFEDMNYLRSCAQALALAHRRPFPVDGKLATVAEGYRQFVTFCGWLAVVESPDPFPLPRAKLTALFDIQWINTIGVWVEWAVRDGFLQTVTPAGGGRFAIDRFPILKERI
ncbi:MAG: hypothetical protein ABSB42_01260 [Tepidisphaeraceae bacterium]